jgi:hypothetical protein
MTITEWTLDHIPAPLGGRARELVDGASFVYVEHDDDPLASPIETLLGEDSKEGESDPRRQEAERYTIYAVLSGRYVTVELTWLGKSDPPTENIEAVALAEIVGIKIKDDQASLDVGTDEDRYTTWVPKVVAEALLKAGKDS